jgi:hypothetical protein
MGSACSSCSIVAWCVVDNQYFVLCVRRVGYCVCCDISARMIRPTDLYATFYMGLFFDMCVSTSLIPFLQCPIIQATCIQSVSGGNDTILGGQILVILNKILYIYTRVLFRTVYEIDLFPSTGVYVWLPKSSFTHAILCPFRFSYGVG